MSTDATTANIDAIFDLAADSTGTPSSTPAQDDNATNGSESNAEATSADKGGALYPNVLKTLTASEAGEENPEGTLTIAEFAAHLTVEAIKAGAGVEGVVDKQNIYTGTKAARHPLPVVLVFADGDDQSDQRTAKVYIPVAEGTEAYKNRPTRGESANTATSKRTKEELIDALAKKTVALGAIVTRRKRAEEQERKATETVEKYHRWLAAHFLGSTPTEITVKDDNGNDVTRTETADEANARALKAAVEARIDEIAAEEDAAKNADIPDTDEAQNA